MLLLSCCQLSLLWCGCVMMKAGVTLCTLLYGMYVNSLAALLLLSACLISCMLCPGAASYLQHIASNHHDGCACLSGM